MSTPGEGTTPDGEASPAQLIAKALADVASPGPHAPRGDLFEGLDRLEEEVLPRHKGDGPDSHDTTYLAKALDIRLTRLGKKARNETWGENIWLAGKVGATFLVLAAAWHYLF